MAQVTLNYVKILLKIEDQLGPDKPTMTHDERVDGIFHSTIEVDLVNWVPKGFRDILDKHGDMEGSKWFPT
uniref:Uncharacterized protein n=1 Tax=Leersia perrieri TaxID=77586 RepID=A0A0D9WQW5_9ORYZ